MTADELHEAIDTGRERRRIADVQSAWIERVTGEQDSGAPIVQRDARRLVTWNRNHVEHPPAEIDDSAVERPASM
jgi:hypothetical protein